MSKRVAVILSGCGAQDGSEIYETTLVLLRLDQLGIGYRCFAPDIEQRQTINHLTGEPMPEEARNVLVEAVRLARGDIASLDALEPGDFDGVVLPGGFGVARNLSDFADAGSDMSVLPLLRDKITPFHDAEKPIGMMCMAPLLVPRLLGPAIPVTVGQNASVAGAISSMGGLHKSCGVEDVVIDREHRVITTPAFMLTDRISEAAKGIFKLVDKLSEMMD